MSTTNIADDIRDAGDRLAGATARTVLLKRDYDQAVREEKEAERRFAELCKQAKAMLGVPSPSEGEKK